MNDQRHQHQPEKQETPGISEGSASNGRGWIRTNEGISHQIYSRSCELGHRLESQEFTVAPLPTTCTIPSAIAGLPALLPLPLHGMVAGIYFLCLGNEVVYVGQSRLVMHRVASHLAEDCKLFDRVFFIPCSPFEADAIELRFIKLLEPRYNGSTIAGGYRAKYSPPNNSTTKHRDAVRHRLFVNALADAGIIRPFGPGGAAAAVVAAGYRLRRKGGRR